MKMKPLTVAALLQCESQAQQLCGALYGTGASLLAQMLCEVATLYAASVDEAPTDTLQVLQQYTAGELADFFEEYQQRFLTKGGNV